ncbi:hypothetical protein [Roseibium salinum]|uniref:Phasin protein n=1 Tax=Roseibium salinum TaxID=1604349 RepID=A0ABT3R840_9HYPH|nr:hypothetical protein [Roseibium sp. DSM 29163]MCX2725212.1 hypothetical protein [Roseibium sp. DSM 29163]
MPSKRTTGPFDFGSMMGEWPMPGFSNWAFAEREDRIEERTLAGFQKMGQTLWSHTEKAFDDHMNFVTHRLHEDFECVKSLSQCTAPEQTMATLQEFYSKMANEYQDHFEKQAALLRESLTENAALVEELNETAMESAAELGKAAEENTKETAQRAKSAALRKSAAKS